MKHGLKHVVGKTIRAVLVKERTRTPQSQVFLVFTDGTYFELYATEGNIYGTSEVRRGSTDDIRAYMPGGKVVLEAQGPTQA